MNQNQPEMNAVQVELDYAWKMLGRIPVADNAVDLMAGARACLKKAFELAADKPSEQCDTEAVEK